ncbi:MAG: response regulator transcription factor [Mariprofundaceae bacterium]|nr:response regulator transcription factor [Mariprofundaceae bacterium]
MMNETEQTNYRVVVIEDDPHTRAYLTKTIAAVPNMLVVGDAGDCAHAMPLLRTEPDIALIDLGLPDGSGLDLIRKRFFKQSTTQFVVITVFGDEAHVMPALEAGACGYLMKDSALPDIAELISQVLSGGSPISPIIARKLLTRFRIDNDQQQGSMLTKREFDVLHLMSKGYNYNETAEHLGISYHTVVSHVRHTYRKLEVTSRAEAIFEASRMGLLNM